MSAPRYFITGTSTEVGKTIVSSIFVEALQADYWKPVQAGELDNSDSHKIARLAKRVGKIYPPQYALQNPMSPHAAAALEDISIDLNDFSLPKTNKPLVVEGAGGLLVPLNEEQTVLDLIQRLALPVVLVSKHYLGSINHTLMSLRILQNVGIETAICIFIGAENLGTESIIKSHFPNVIYHRIPWQNIDSDFISREAARLAQILP